MENKEQLTLLIEIGRLDQKISMSRDSLLRLKKDTAVSEAEAAELEVAITILAEQKSELIKRRRVLDEKLQNEKANLRKWEARAEKIKGEREYTALMSEISAQKRTITGVTAELAEVTEELETREEALLNKTYTREAIVSRAKTSLDAVKDLVLEEENNLSTNNDARKRLLNLLPKPLQLRYERIHANRNNFGIAFLKDGVCLSCMRVVPPELFIRVAKGEVIEQCPSCLRFLVVEQENIPTS